VHSITATDALATNRTITDDEGLALRYAHYGLKSYVGASTPFISATLVPITHSELITERDPKSSGATRIAV
jgi:hypothetical protein